MSIFLCKFINGCILPLIIDMTYYCNNYSFKVLNIVKIAHCPRSSPYLSEGSFYTGQCLIEEYLLEYLIYCSEILSLLTWFLSEVFLP